MTEQAAPHGPTEALPLFSILTPVYNTPVDVLRTTIASVRAQTLPEWELILVDDCSPNEEVRTVLREEAALDPRIRVIERTENGHIVAASNDGLDAARAEYTALLDHDDLLVPRALEFVRMAIEADPDADYLYSDEDKVDESGRIYDQFRKPTWSPERLRGHMYTCHFSVVRTALAREVGGFHEGFEGSQDHDLVLRVTERGARVVHIQRILYHWRVIPGSAAGDPHAKPYAWSAGRRAVQAHLDRLGLDAEVDFGPGQGTYSIKRRLDPSVAVSVVIATRGAEGLVWGERRWFVVEAVRSLIERGGHDNLEIVVVHDDVTPEIVLDELRQVAANQLRLVSYDKEFNFSEKCNLGVLSSHGEVVVLLNDDIEVSSDGFLTQLVAPLFEDGVGMTGARLLLSNTLVQHAGLALDSRLDAIIENGRRNHPGPFVLRGGIGGQVGNALMVNRECSGVSAACLAIKRDLYEDLGGLSESFPVNFADADLSLKVGRAGYRVLWMADAVAYHFEAQSREPLVRRGECRRLLRRWDLPEHDRYLPDLPENPLTKGRGARPGHQAPSLTGSG